MCRGDVVWAFEGRSSGGGRVVSGVVTDFRYHDPAQVVVRLDGEDRLALFHLSECFPTEEGLVAHIESLLK